MSRVSLPTLMGSAAIGASLLLGACTIQRQAPPGQTAAVDDHLAHMSPSDLAAPATTTSADFQQKDDLRFPASNKNAAARVAATPRHAEWVKIPMGSGATDTLMAWVVYPKTNAKAPVVVVVHEIFGLSTWVRGVADQVAADGFIAIAPDFLSRLRGAPTSVELPADTARAMIGGVNTAERNRIIAAAANYAMMLPAATQKYAVIGYCWGGQTVFAHGVNNGVKGFSGGVAFYGAFPYLNAGTPATATTAAVPQTVNADSVAKINAPIMLLNGSKDARIAAMMPAIDSLMKLHKKNYSATNYEGAIHGFLRAQDDGRAPAPARGSTPAEAPEAVVAESAANLAATRDGWPKTIAFLKKNLGVK